MNNDEKYYFILGMLVGVGGMFFIITMRLLLFEFIKLIKKEKQMRKDGLI
jgi:hypothetical protein